MARRYPFTKIAPYKPPTTADLATGAEGAWSCLSDIDLGDFVYVSGDGTVSRASGASLLTLPCIGVVIYKASPTTALVRYTGETTIVRTPTLIPSAIYFLGDNGTIFTPSEGSSSLPYRQIIGRAKDFDTLILTISLPYEVQ